MIVDFCFDIHTGLQLIDRLLVRFIFGLWSSIQSPGLASPLSLYALLSPPFPPPSKDFP